MSNESAQGKVSFSDKNRTFEVFFPKECDLDKINRVTIRGREFIEVVHGEWIMLDPINFIEMCSVCRHIDYTAKRHPRYCPHCGARMDKEEKNDEQID